MAAGEALPFRDTGPRLRGHAIECRIYAEDPDNQFFPSPGTIASLDEPSGPGIRVDSGIYPGWRVPIEYDPLLAKLVAYAESREQAIARLRRALDEYVIGGVRTNLPLFRRIVSDSDFLAGKTDTGYLARLVAPRVRAVEPNHHEVAAIAAAIFAARDRMNGNRGALPAPRSLWKKAAREELLRER
jgi:acetyl-CoA carboxylase biotin carboxylase subunit